MGVWRWSTPPGGQDSLGLLDSLCGWLADRLHSLEAGYKGLRRPSAPTLKPKLVDGHGNWFSLEVKPEWAPWAFAKDDPNKVIAALELLATLIEFKLWHRKKCQPVQRSPATEGYDDQVSLDLGANGAGRRALC